MGCRGQVKVVEFIDDGPTVFLYTHWGADELPLIVRDALKKKLRWNDCDYLTRIIFCDMVKDATDEETGYGISTKEHEDNKVLVTVDCTKQEVTIDRSMWGGKKSDAVSFEQFIQPDVAEELDKSVKVREEDEEDES